MTDKHTPETRKLDDQIADFTDRLLANDIRQEVDSHVQDQALLELQETAVSLKRSFGSEQPSEDVLQRIKSILVNEWHKTNSASTRQSFWQHYLTSWQSTLKSSTNRKYAFALAFATMVVILVIIYATSLSTTRPELIGTANGQTGPIPIFLAIGLVIIFVFWLTRHKR